MNEIILKKKQKELYPGLVTFYEFCKMKKLIPSTIIKNAERWNVTLPKVEKCAIRIGVPRSFYKLDDMNDFYKRYFAAKESRMLK